MVEKIYKVLLFAGAFGLFLFMPASVIAAEMPGQLRISQEVEKTGQIPVDLDETVIYELEGFEGAPLPKQGETFRFTVAGDKAYILDFGKDITYKKNGLYTYRLSTKQSQKSALKVKKAEYQIDCLVKKNGDRDLYVTDLESGKKVDQIHVTPTYKGDNLIDRLSKKRSNGNPKTGDSRLGILWGIVLMAALWSFILAEKKKENMI